LFASEHIHRRSTCLIVQSNLQAFVLGALVGLRCAFYVVQIDHLADNLLCHHPPDIRLRCGRDRLQLRRGLDGGDVQSFLDPKGSLHYHDATQACAFAVRDLHVRASEDLVRTEIVGRSDRTGYVAVGRGTTVARNTAVTAIGRGKSEEEADRNALQKLTDREATSEEVIVYRYFPTARLLGAIRIQNIRPGELRLPQPTSDARSLGASQLYGGSA